MPTRRELIWAALISFAAALAPALPDMTRPLEVTYYYLPG